MIQHFYHICLALFGSFLTTFSTDLARLKCLGTLVISPPPRNPPSSISSMEFGILALTTSPIDPAWSKTPGSLFKPCWCHEKWQSYEGLKVPYLPSYATLRDLARPVPRPRYVRPVEPCFCPRVSCIHADVMRMFAKE